MDPIIPIQTCVVVVVVVVARSIHCVKSRRVKDSNLTGTYAVDHDIRTSPRKRPYQIEGQELTHQFARTCHICGAFTGAPNDSRVSTFVDMPKEVDIAANRGTGKCLRR